jgi:hypothetical protein
MLLFIGALIGGGIVVYDIISHDRKQRPRG